MLSVGVEVDILPAVPAHTLTPANSATSEPFGSQDGLSGLPRSASYTHIPGVPESQSAGSLKRTFSDNVITLSPNGSTKPRQSPYVPSKELLRSASTSGKGKVAVTKFTLSAEDLGSAMGKEPKKSTAVGVIEKLKPSTGRSVSNTFRNLARRPWKSSSRSRSPSPEEARKLAKSRNISPLRKRSPSIVSEPVPAPLLAAPFSQSSNTKDAEPEDSAAVDLSLSHRPLLLRKPSRRPLSAILHINKSETEVLLAKRRSLSSLRSKCSADHLPRSTLVKVPPIPSSLSSDRLCSASLDTNKKRDPLWNVFRTLEGDFQK